MKYFTPELYVRSQAQDGAAIEAVEREWEDNVDRYDAYLGQIRPMLPPGVVYLLDNFYLHDARIVNIGQNRTTFLIDLKTDPPYASLVLTYHLTEEARVDQEALPAEHRTAHVEWLYDELELLASDPPVFGHNILLSNGWEMQLRFRDLRVTAVHPVLLTESEQRYLDSNLQGAGPYTLPPQPAASPA